MGQSNIKPNRRPYNIRRNWSDNLRDLTMLAKTLKYSTIGLFKF